MAIVYIKLYQPLHDAPAFSKNPLGSRCEIEYLKSVGPDDGEAITHQGRFGITCPDDEWKEVVEQLKESGESLVYSVVKQSANGEIKIAEAGELNSDVMHYTTRSNNRGRIFAIWFQDCLPETPGSLAACWAPC